ncbi:MAG: imidazole glycerol phosphate synthase subunit HisH [Burkholderiaceae bacterium]|jgi:glutamine amidotransferase
MIAIVDYGGGNVRSVLRAVMAANAHQLRAGEVSLVRDPDLLRRADRIIFPGQGAMPDCMASLAQSGLSEALREAISQKPFFGICVGQQMLFEHSEEGDTAGLGIIPGQVIRFTPARGAVGADGRPLKVPHMGWNRVAFRRPHPVLEGLGTMGKGDWFYFVHSFHAEPALDSDVLGEADYGRRFVCAVARDNIIATQFHPEKSAAAGQRLLVNFCQWKPS